MIIAVKEKDRVIVGCCYSELVIGLTEGDYINEENTPMTFLEDGKFVVMSNPSRVSDILIYDDKFLSIEVSPKAIINDTIPYIKRALKENQYAISRNGTWDNSVTYVDGTRIYDIDPTFGFREVDDYVCHGIDVNVVMGVLDATEGLSAEKRILNAVSFASKIKKVDWFPLIIVDTKTREVKHIMKEETR